MTFRSLPHRLSEDQFVEDLATLFRRYRLRTGSPDCVRELAPSLESNMALRGDLFGLCTAISHMGDADLSAEELLRLVARAMGGPRMVEANIPERARAIFLTEFEQWTRRNLEMPTEAGPSEPLAEVSEEEPLPKRTMNPFSAAAALSSSERSSRRGPITPDTPIGQLTVAELRSYLEEIEHRVSRLHLSSLDAMHDYNGSQGKAAIEPAEVEPVPIAIPAPPVSTPQMELLEESVHATEPAPVVIQAAPVEEKIEPVPEKLVEVDEPVRAEQLLRHAIRHQAGDEEPFVLLPLRNDPRARPEPEMFSVVTEEERGGFKGFAIAAVWLLLLGGAGGYGYYRLKPELTVSPPPPPPASQGVPAPPVSPDSGLPVQPQQPVAKTPPAADTSAPAASTPAPAGGTPAAAQPQQHAYTRSHTGYARPRTPSPRALQMEAEAARAAAANAADQQAAGQPSRPSAPIVRQPQ